MDELSIQSAIILLRHFGYFVKEQVLAPSGQLLVAYRRIRSFVDYFSKFRNIPKPYIWNNYVFNYLFYQRSTPC